MSNERIDWEYTEHRCVIPIVINEDGTDIIAEFEGGRLTPLGYESKCIYCGKIVGLNISKEASK